MASSEAVAQVHATAPPHSTGRLVPLEAAVQAAWGAQGACRVHGPGGGPKLQGAGVMLLRMLTLVDGAALQLVGGVLLGLVHGWAGKRNSGVLCIAGRSSPPP